MPHFRQDKGFRERPEQAVFLYGFNTNPKHFSWDQYREQCYQDLKNKYKVYITKFDIGRQKEFGYLHLKSKEMADKLKSINNYKDPQTGEMMSRVKLAGTNIVVYPYLKDRNHMLTTIQARGNSTSKQGQPEHETWDDNWNDREQGNLDFDTTTSWSDFEPESGSEYEPETEASAPIQIDDEGPVDPGLTGSHEVVRRTSSPDINRQETVKPANTSHESQDQSLQPDVCDINRQDTLKPSDQSSNTGLLMDFNDAVEVEKPFINVVPEFPKMPAPNLGQYDGPYSTSRSRADSTLSVADSFMAPSRGEEDEAEFMKKLRDHLPEVFWTLPDHNRQTKIETLRNLWLISLDSFYAAAIAYSDDIMAAHTQMEEANRAWMERQQQEDQIKQYNAALAVIVQQRKGSQVLHQSGLPSAQPNVYPNQNAVFGDRLYQNTQTSYIQQVPVQPSSTNISYNYNYNVAVNSGDANQAHQRSLTGAMNSLNLNTGTNMHSMMVNNDNLAPAGLNSGLILPSLVNNANGDGTTSPLTKETHG